MHLVQKFGNKGKNLAGRSVTIVVCLMAILLSLLDAPDSHAGVPITLYRSYAGNMDFTGTGGTLRANPNPISCTLTPISTGNLSGIPPTATITAAYLYWAGSYNLPGVPADYNVTLNGNNIAADRTFTEIFPFGGTNYNFFSGFKDVTSIVAAARNGNYTFANLTVNNGAPHCGVAAVLSGWSLVVIYEEPSEPLRVINVFDGFQYYRGGSITLTPSNFQIPATTVDGKQGYISWEGDAENSAQLNGVNENLQFNGSSLTDILNPLNNQFNSTINILPSTTTYGVDHDIYNISPYLSPGDTSATSVYSSGGDLVILSAEIISVTNTPVADLGVVKSHTGSFTVGQTGNYSILVTNNGPSNATTVTVTDTLPAGLNYLSSSGTGWTADTSASPIIAWTHSGPLVSSASLPAISLSVDVLAAAAPTVTNIAAVAGATFDNISANDTSSDLTTVLTSDLSTSTKTVLDINGGDAGPGDTLRYTITLIESGGVAATGVSVTDNLPANATSLSVVSYPSGATDNSTGVLLDISGIDVLAGGGATIVFDVIVIGTANPGDLIDNTATINNPSGTGTTPAATTVIVSQSLIPSSGNKPLYLTTANLTRVVPGGGLGNIPINGGATMNWVLNPALATTLIVDGTTGNIPVALTLGEAGPGQRRNYTLSVSSSAIGTFATLTLINVDLNPPINPTYNLPLTTPGDKMLPPGSTIMLTITNNQAIPPPNRVIVVNPNNSYVNLPSNTVVNVDSVLFYDAAYAGGASITTTKLGSMVYVRAVASDPFGSFDISSADVTIVDPLGTPVVSGVAMTRVADSGAATRTYEKIYVIPAGGPGGTWTAQVTANEGSEGTVSHTGTGTVTVPVADLTITKSHSGSFAAGQNGSYSVLVANNGPNPATTVTVTDTLPAGLTYISSAGTGWVADTSFLPTVVWSHSGPVTSGSDYPLITLTVAVGATAVPTVTNIAAVAGSTYDNLSADNTSSDLTTVIAQPDLAITKVVQVLRDPVSGVLNPKAIPGAELEYILLVTNMGYGTASTDSVFITDPLAGNSDFYVGDYGGPGSGPVLFADGAVISGLSYTYSSLGSTTDDIEFSNDGGLTFTHTPVPDGNGYDTSVPPVDQFRLNPKGPMSATDGTNHPSFTIRYLIKLH